VPDTPLLWLIRRLAYVARCADSHSPVDALRVR
jgi:hypothetical protein